MRVAFSGCSGTGKTTLAKWMAEEFNLPLNPVGSRSTAAEMGLASGYEADALGRRKEFSERLIRGKIGWEADHAEFVTDRTTLDDLTYAALSDVSVIDDALLEDAIQGMRRYTHVILCPVSSMQRIEGDPTRLNNKAYHAIFEALLRGLIRKHLPQTEKGVPIVGIIYSPVLEHRKREIEGLLGDPL